MMMTDKSLEGKLVKMLLLHAWGNAANKQGHSERKKRSMFSKCELCIYVPLFVISTGLPTASSLWGNPHPSWRGATHHPEGPKPSPAAVGPARLRVRGACAGRRPPCDGAALQQHQRAVPEQLGMTSSTPTGSLTALR